MMAHRLENDRVAALRPYNHARLLKIFQDSNAPMWTPEAAGTIIPNP